MNLRKEDFQLLIDRSIAEDLGEKGDITSLAIFQEKIGVASIQAKQKGILAGIEIAKQVFTTIDPSSQFKNFVNDGNIFYDGDSIAEISAPVKSLLQAERTALNFLGRLSGIATLTGLYVKKVHGNRCKVLDTRKTTPGWRRLEKYAVEMGGGNNHRFGLYDMVLIKDNHITAAGGITTAVQNVRSYLAENNISAEIEVEVTNIEQLREAISLKVNRIMLDNMSIDMMKQAVEINKNRIPLEASGNINLNSISQIASIGVDYISIGALTHSADCVDFAMKMSG